MSPTNDARGSRGARRRASWSRRCVRETHPPFASHVVLVLHVPRRSFVNSDVSSGTVSVGGERVSRFSARSRLAHTRARPRTRPRRVRRIGFRPAPTRRASMSIAIFSGVPHAIRAISVVGGLSSRRVFAPPRRRASVRALAVLPPRLVRLRRRRHPRRGGYQLLTTPSRRRFATT